MSVVNEVSDIAADLISGTFGPIGAAAASLAEQTFTDNTVEEMKANNEKYNDFLNYQPRTDLGKAANKGAMEAIGSGVAAVGEFYTENEAKIPDVVKSAVSTTVDTWNDLDEETRFALGNLATVGELVPVGKIASLAKKFAKVDAPDVGMSDADAAGLAAWDEVMGYSPENVAYNEAVDKLQEEGQSGWTGLNADNFQVSADVENMMRLISLGKGKVTVDSRPLTDYLGGKRDGAQILVIEDNSLRADMDHIKTNKVQEFTALVNSTEFADVPQPVLEKALTKYKRPEVTAENLKEAFFYQNMQDLKSSLGGNPKGDASAKDLSYKVADLDAEFDNLIDALDIDGAIDDVEAALQVHGGMYRALDLTNTKDLKDFKALVAKEKKVYKRYQTKYKNRPDVQLYKGMPTRGKDKNVSGGNAFELGYEKFKPIHGEDARKAMLGGDQAELSLPMMSTTTDPNFLSYQSAFGGDDVAKVVEGTMNAADYNYLAYNMTPGQYDVRAGNLPDSTYHEASRARGYDLGIAGGDSVIPTKLPHSDHLESEVAIADPQNMEWLELRDDPKKLKLYEKSMTANELFNGRSGMPPPVTKVEIAHQKALNELFKSVDPTELKDQKLYGPMNKASNLNQVDRLRKIGERLKDFDYGEGMVSGVPPAQRKAIYNEYKNTLKSLIAVGDATQGQGLRGSYIGKLQTLVDKRIMNGMIHAAQLFPKGSLQQNNLLDLWETLQPLGKGYMDKQIKSATDYQRIQPTMTRDMLELTDKFAEGGLAGEMESLGLSPPSIWDDVIT